LAHDELTAILVAASPLGPVLIPDHEKPSQEEEIPPDHVELAFKSPPAARPGILDKLPLLLGGFCFSQTKETLSQLLLIYETEIT
jgi:hypothetical protein